MCAARSRAANDCSRYIAILGPGMITANAGNDAGGIATFASVGAEFGYSLLWILIPITISVSASFRRCARAWARSPAKDSRI